MNGLRWSPSPSCVRAAAIHRAEDGLDRLIENHARHCSGTCYFTLLENVMTSHIHENAADCDDPEWDGTPKPVANL